MSSHFGTFVLITGNNVDNTQDVYNLIRKTAIGGQRPHNGFIESNVLRVTSKYPIMDTTVQDESTPNPNAPILQKVQGEFIVTGGGGGGDLSFFSAPEGSFTSQVATPTELAALLEDIDDTQENTTTTNRLVLIEQVAYF